MALNLTLLVFIAINLLILFAVRTRTSIVITLLISQLVAILFFSQILLNFNSFKEVILAVVIYVMVILGVATSDTASRIINVSEQNNLSLKSQNNKLFFVLVASGCLIIFTAVFMLIIKLPMVHHQIKEKKFNQQKELILNPIILPSHPVHKHIKKYYFHQNFFQNNDQQIANFNEEQEIKKAQMKDQLVDNFVLKRSSDVIIIFAGFVVLALIYSKKKFNYDL